MATWEGRAFSGRKAGDEAPGKDELDVSVFQGTRSVPRLVWLGEREEGRRSRGRTGRRGRRGGPDPMG